VGTSVVTARLIALDWRPSNPERLAAQWADGAQRDDDLPGARLLAATKKLAAICLIGDQAKIKQTRKTAATSDR
jgi:hypothetical protein